MIYHKQLHNDEKIYLKKTESADKTGRFTMII